MRQRYWHRHKFWRFCAGITKHHALVPCPIVIYAHSNLWGLFVNIVAEARFLAESPFRLCIAKSLYGVPGNFFIIYLCFCFDLAKQTNLVSASHGFYACMGMRILFERSIHYGIADGVAQLVRVTGTD